jgi:hypothetical protein
MTQPRRVLRERAFELAAKVFKLFPVLSRTGPEFAYLARQLLRAVTSDERVRSDAYGGGQETAPTGATGGKSPSARQSEHA